MHNLRPAVLTLKEPPVRSWLSKVVLAGALGCALGWSGMHLDIGKRFKALWHDISAAEKSSIVPTPTPVSGDAAAPVGPGNFSPGLSSEAPANDKNPSVPEQGAGQSILSSREPN